MPCFITHSVVNGQDSSQNRNLAVQKGLAMSHQLAVAKNCDILVIVPNIQHLDSGHVSSALGDVFAKSIKKPEPFKVNGVTISRTSKIPSFFGANTVVWMLWPSLVTAEAVSKSCQGVNDIVATEWVPYDELNRWRVANKAKQF
ncbi:hypothetical protein [Enterobacter hormaechei]|uniref:hypothetical protein n=1 Tax=Enterobacter hormaechei TaxID=158836 RepID=UPI002074C1F7|nr:hypothetical protein [unidentified bacterial endosymbiont]MCM7196450.1 hypothetical protein [Enterobacter hormaechei]